MTLFLEVVATTKLSPVSTTLTCRLRAQDQKVSVVPHVWLLEEDSVTSPFAIHENRIRVGALFQPFGPEFSSTRVDLCLRHPGLVYLAELLAGRRLANNAPNAAACCFPGARLECCASL